LRFSFQEEGKREERGLSRVDPEKGRENSTPEGKGVASNFFLGKEEGRCTG